MTDSNTPGEETLQPSTTAGVGYGDAVIGIVLLMTFVAAFITARQWEAIASYFPLAAASIGIALCAVFVARCIIVLRGRGGHSLPLSSTLDSESDALTGDQMTPSQADSDRAFFASVSVRDWSVTLAYFLAFFAALYVLGLYPTSIVFSVIYLRFQARSSWPASVIYAAVMTAALYALFEMTLTLPVPPGLMGLS